MADLQSPATTIAATNAAQRLSETDATPYAAICLVNRKGNSGSINAGGPQVLNGAGGKQLDQGDDFWFGPAPGLQWRLTEIYVAGTSGDAVDTICKPW